MNLETVNNRMPVTTQISSPVLSLPSPPAPALKTSHWGQNPQQIKILLLIFPPSAAPNISVLQHQLSLYFCPGFSGNTKTQPLGKLSLHPADAQQLHGSENIL